MLLAETAQTVILLLVVALILLVYFVILIVFVRTLRPWMQAFMSGVPVTVVEILGMRLRRSDVNAVLRALIMAKQAGVTLSCREVELAHLQGVDLEKLILAMIHAKKHDVEVTFEELVEADLEDRLAEKLQGQGDSVSRRKSTSVNGPKTAEMKDQSVRICRTCSKQISDDSKICRNCGAIL